MKRLKITVTFLFLMSIVQNNAMEVSKEKRDDNVAVQELLTLSQGLREKIESERIVIEIKSKTPVELLTELCLYRLHQKIEDYETSEDKELQNYAKGLKECSYLDHIRVTYNESIFGFTIRKKEYLQLENSKCFYKSGNVKRTSKRKNKKIESFNNLLNESITTFKSQKKRDNSQKNDLFTAHINLIPLQNFFFELMPWPNRNPWLFASGLTTLGIATTYMLMRK